MEPRSRIPSTARTILLLLQIAHVLAIKILKNVFGDPNPSQNNNLAYLEPQQGLKPSEYLKCVMCLNRP